MKHLFTFSLLLILTISIKVNAQDFSQKISVEARNQTLSQILTDLEKTYDLSFSYLNNELPQEKMTITYINLRLDDALHDLLDPYKLEYVVHADKIIVKKKAQVAKPTITASKPILKEEPTSVPADTTSTNLPIVETVQTLTEEIDSLLSEIEVVQNPEPIEEYSSPDEEPAAFSPKLIYISSEDSVENFEDEPLDVTYLYQPSSDSIEETRYLQESWFHIGVFFPFSSHAYFAGDYINHISIHAISGYSGGLSGFEMSGLLNITNGNADGIQIAGLSNIVKGNVSGSQISGVTNLSTGETIGLQTAGAINVTKGDLLGTQIGGAINVAQGEISGLQIAGGINVSKGEVKFGQIGGFLNAAGSMTGPQIAGFMNIQKTEGIGLQAAGFMNQSKDLTGAQISGFTNKARDIEGAQIAPFVNKARHVKGTQIGLINICETIEGTPIGLLNIVRRNGYYDLELFYSDDFQANAIIKLGAKHFHNLFAFSYETDGKNRWMYGYGFGSQWGNNGFRVNTDVLTYYIVEEKFPDGAFSDYDLNLLSKFRLLASLHAGSFGVFAGPTVNVLTSKYFDAETGKYGSDIGPKALYETTESDHLYIKLWVGYNIGIRF